MTDRLACCLKQFLDEVVLWLECSDANSGPRVADDLRGIRDISPQHLAPVGSNSTESLGWFQSSLRSPEAISLTQSLETIAPVLDWRVNEMIPMMHTKLVGPDGVLPCDRFLFGAFLIAPDTVYPLHSHAALETYIILSGQSRWWNSDAGYQPEPPGTVIVHEPFQPHAMRTGSEPLLTLWAWQGDIGFESYRFEPEGVDANGVAI